MGAGGSAGFITILHGASIGGGVAAHVGTTAVSEDGHDSMK